MIQAVCFDMDGVLMDTERLGAGVLIETAQLQGFHITFEQARSCIGASTKVTLDKLKSWCPDIDTERFLPNWRDTMFACVRREMPIKPHATQVLKALKDMGLKLALCTSNALCVVEEYFRLAGWEGLFDQVVTGEMVQTHKPEPEVYLTAAARLGVTPQECIGVEDSFNGVRAVRAAGMTSVMIPDVLPFSEAFAPYVDHVLPDLLALQAMIDKER